MRFIDAYDTELASLEKQRVMHEIIVDEVTAMHMTSAITHTHTHEGNDLPLLGELNHRQLAANCPDT